jgi:hypothetical protein
MSGPRIAAVIVFLVTARCLPIPLPAQAAGPFTAWYMQGTERVPIMTFADVAACARAAEILAAKAETYVGCVEGLLPNPEPPKSDTLQPAASPRPQPQARPSASCSITGTDFGLTAVCKSF